MQGYVQVTTMFCRYEGVIVVKVTRRVTELGSAMGCVTYETGIVSGGGSKSSPTTGAVDGIEMQENYGGITLPVARARCKLSHPVSTRGIRRVSSIERAEKRCYAAANIENSNC